MPWQKQIKQKTPSDNEKQNTSSLSCRGTKIPQAAQWGQKKFFLI